MLTNEQLLAIACLSGLIGAAFQFVHNKTDAATYNIAQRLFSMLVGAFLAALVALLLIMVFTWNGVLVAILNLFFGLGAEKILRLMMESQNSAKSPEEFINKWKKVKQALSDTDPTPPPTPDVPPTNEPKS